jgi:large subunit ribosomal protein L15
MENLKRPATRTRKKRVGRGNSSGKGTYSGKGLKGQRARSGGRRGMMRRSAFKQLIMRTPKLRGFKRESFAIQTVSLSDLNNNFNEGGLVDEKSLAKLGIINSGKGGVKVLGNGIIKKKLNVKVSYFSKSAKIAIESAGGKCENL